MSQSDWEKRRQGCAHRGGRVGPSGEKRNGPRKQPVQTGQRASPAATLRATRTASRAASPALPPAHPSQGPPEAADVTTNNPSLCVGVEGGRDRLNSSFSGCAALASPIQRSSLGKQPSTLAWETRPLGSVGGLLPCAVTADLSLTALPFMPASLRLGGPWHEHVIGAPQLKPSVIALCSDSPGARPATGSHVDSRFLSLSGPNQAKGKHQATEGLAESESHLCVHCVLWTRFSAPQSPTRGQRCPAQRPLRTSGSPSVGGTRQMLSFFLSQVSRLTGGKAQARPRCT